MTSLLRIFRTFGIAFALSWLFMSAAWAHAVVLSTTPTDEAILDAPPAQARIQFNEPVSILGLSLVGPGGAAEEFGDYSVEGTTITIALPPDLSRGTHALSWRVISGDGHPVNGSAVFSIGEVTATPMARSGDPILATLLWASKVLFYLGVFVGAGSAASRTFLGPLPPRLKMPVLVLSAIGIAAGLAGIGFQGLDALGLGLNSLANPAAWTTGFSTGYGLTILSGIIAILIGIAVLGAANGPLSRGGWLVLVFAGLAFAATGHASTASPQWLTRPSVFLHGAAITFWIGSLAPLFYFMTSPAADAADPLRRFSNAIPYVVVALVGSGLILVTVQTGLSPSSILTGYGTLLAIKLVLVAILFAIAARNRFKLTGLSLAGQAEARGRLRRNVLVELAIVFVIFGLVAGWRFTPPPRALAQQSHMTTEEVLTHFHNDIDLWGAWITFQPTGSNSGNIIVEPLGENDVPIEVEDVVVELARPDIGVEPFERQAEPIQNSRSWIVEDIALPAAGSWQGSVTMLLSAFEETEIGGELFLDAMPTPAAASASGERTTIELNIVAGALEDAEETIRVRLGDEVELRWSVDDAQFIHLHGYDVLMNVTPEEPVSMQFTANIPGRFPIETHGRTAGNVAYLEVTP